MSFTARQLFGLGVLTALDVALAEALSAIAGLKGDAARVPELGGGPRTSIFAAGSDEFTSFQVLYGFAISDCGFAGSGTCFASARYTSRRVSFMFGLFFECASTMPSYPTFTSTISFTPFLAHWSTSLCLMRREAFAMSGC